MACDLQDLREAADCGFQNMTLKQIAWANVQIACKLRDWFASDGTFDPVNECNLDELIDEGRCVNASLLELAYFQAQVMCQLVNVITQGGDPPSGLCSPWMLRKFGHGSPEGVVVGCFGDVYTDLDTGDFYKKAANNGGNTGWV